MKKLLLSSALLAASCSVFALDLKELGQQAVNQGIQNAVTGAIEGKSGKEILKQTGEQTKEQSKQQLQQQAADMAKQAPTADSNPMGAIATDIAAQKAAQKAGGGEKGQLASDLIKGVSGAIQSKVATPAEAAPVATTTPNEAPKADATASAPKKSTGKTKKSAAKKKKSNKK